MGDVSRRGNSSTLPRRRRISGTWATLSTLLRRKPFQMSEGRRSQIVLLDERRLDLIIQSRLYAGDLLDIVASHFNLKEKDYFGICYVDDTGQNSWLSLDKRVLEHDFPKKNNSQESTLTLYFRIKYFVESITQLRDSATIEAFYLQTKSLIAKGELEIDSDIIFQLAALVIQVTYGDYTDEQTFKTHLKRLPVLPTSTLKEYPSIAVCETQVLEHYQALVGQTRGAAIVNYLSIVESLPTYGQHYYEIKDKTGTPCWLGLSYRGISQYDKNDRKNPRRVFFWKQLENLYFRDRKFTIEVHEVRRVVHTLSSFNLYEDAIEEPVEEFDDLSNAICDPTTQVSVSRRALAPASVTVFVWYASSSNAAKCIWSMAISQHQFFLDRNQKKSRSRMVRSLSQIASELSRSVQSLSSTSSQSNISRSNSSASLPTIVIEGELSEESKAATLEMLTALQSRKDALQDALKKKTEELKVLCLKEGELTGELPPETPFQPGEAQPQVRRRVGTSFTISDKIIYRAKSKDRETINDLELDYEIQSKITSAALKLANDATARKSVRKMRKLSYQQASSKLKDIEEKISTLKRQKCDNNKEQDRSGNLCVTDSKLNSIGLPNSSSENSISDRSNLKTTFSNSTVLPSASLPHLNEGASASEPPSPSKCRQRHQSLQHVPILTDDVYEDMSVPSVVCTRRNSSSYSTTSEYDAISCGSSSGASLGAPYRNRFETHLDIEGTNHYSVPNRRASQAFNDPDEFLLDDKSQDASSQYYMDMTQSNRCMNTPLSCSYDERLSFSKSDLSLANKGFQEDSNYDNVSIRTNGESSLKRFDSAFKLPLSKEHPRHNTFSHSHSVNSLHRAHTNSLHRKISQGHISDPDFNVDSVDGSGNIRHGFSVPTLRASLRPLNSSLMNPSADYPVSVSSQSINQVADLVQASVLLQDSKRAASCNPEIHSSKVKTKEWTETSLDSPIITRKRKPKIMENCSFDEPVQSTEWLENGLPSGLNETVNSYPQIEYYDDSHNFSQICTQLHNSPPLIKNILVTDYRTTDSSDLYASHKKPLSNASRNLFPESNQYHHYENIEELSCHSPNVHSNQSNAYYENIPKERDYCSNNASRMPDILEDTIHSIRHIDLKEDYNEGHNICSAIAQPQEPPKNQTRSVDDADVQTHDYCNIPLDNDYEPIEFGLKPDHVSFPPTHCDIPKAACQYACRNSYPDSFMSKHDENIPHDPSAQQWQPVSAMSTSLENSPVSPVPHNMNLSPTVEVNVVSVGHFQPYWEETKPYELSDFYKYSTKHRRQFKTSPISNITNNFTQQPVRHHTGANNQLSPSLPETSSNFSSECNQSTKGSFYPVNTGPPQTHLQQIVTSSVPIFDNQEQLEISTKYSEAGSPTLPVLRHPEDPDRSLSLGDIDLRMSLADTFHDEMVTWYQNQDSVKKATLV